MTAYIADTTVIRDGRTPTPGWRGCVPALRQQDGQRQQGVSSGWLQPQPVLESALACCAPKPRSRVDNDPC
jgi:hypothetical protein